MLQRRPVPSSYGMPAYGTPTPSTHALTKAGLAHLMHAGTWVEALRKGEESVQTVHKNRSNLMMSVANSYMYYQNILDIGGPYMEGKGEHWKRIKSKYLCSYAMVSLLDGKVGLGASNPDSASTNRCFRPTRTDLVVGFPVVGDQQTVDDLMGLLTPMLSDDSCTPNPAAVVALTHHACKQVDSAYVCGPMQHMIDIADELLGTTVLQNDNKHYDGVQTILGGGIRGVIVSDTMRQLYSLEHHYQPQASGCAGSSSGSAQLKSNFNRHPGGCNHSFSKKDTPISSKLTVSIVTMDPFPSTPFSSRSRSSSCVPGTVHATSMFDMMTKHFSSSSSQSSMNHFAANECCVVHNTKMLSVHHLCAPKNAKHCLATVVLCRRGATDECAKYTHVAMLDMTSGDVAPRGDKSMRKHHRFLSSFHMLSKHCLSAGDPSVNPLHTPPENIREVRMDTYDSVWLSDSLSFFWAPMTVRITGIEDTMASVSDEHVTYDVGMSIQSLRHLPNDTTVFLGQELRLPAALPTSGCADVQASGCAASAWTRSMLAECAKSGMFTNV